MNTLLVAAFAMGFLGSPHCLGMCGGIVSAFGISMQGLSPSKQTALIASYHLGRLISYAVLGVVATLIGSAVLAPFAHSPVPRAVLGVSLAFAGLLMLGLPVLNRLERLGLRFWQSLGFLRVKLFPLTSFPKALAAGLLWGFLPCGLVYGAIGVAIASASGSLGYNMAFGAVFMAIFGLGTLPMLLATQSVVRFLQRFLQKFSVRRWGGAIMVLSGLMVAIPAVLHTHSHHSHNNNHDHHHNAHAVATGENTADPMIQYSKHTHH